MDVALNQAIENLFQQTDEEIAIVNHDGKILFLNSKAKNTLKNFHVQDSFFSIVQTNNEEWLNFIQTVVLEKNFNATFTLKTDSQQLITMNVKGHAIQEKQLIFCNLRLYTRLKTNFDQQNFQYLINDMSYGVILTSMEGKIISANPISLKLLGFDGGNFENQNYELLFEYCDYDKQALLQYYKKIANKEFANICVKCKGIDRQQYYLNIVSKIDDILGILVTTVMNQTEKIELTEMVNHQKALSIVGQNVASILHEIRNPMASIQGFIQMIKENAEDKINPYFLIVETELHRMNEMLMDLLMVSKPRKYEMSELDLKNVLEQATMLLQAKGMKNHIPIIMEFDEHTSYFIKGNGNRLKQMLINLLKNAIEASDTNGVIFVRLYYAEPTILRLVIEDRGKGMSAEQLREAFNSFYSTKETGTGLGLLVVRSVVDEHYGKLTIVSNEGYGTTFTIDFDLLANTQNEVVV